MKVTFYFDPACPWCWITSRWLTVVSKKRQLEINWQPFSLAMKNRELGKRPDSPNAYSHLASHQVLRVIMAAVELHGADIGKLYTAFGRAHHVEQKPYDDKLIDTILAELKLPAQLAKEAGNGDWDADIKTYLDEAVGLVGDDVGVPIIVFQTSASQERGYFGPVLTKLPDEKTALELWDGLSRLAVVNDFYELKRSRGGVDADTSSTADLN